MWKKLLRQTKGKLNLIKVKEKEDRQNNLGLNY